MPSSFSYEEDEEEDSSCFITLFSRFFPLRKREDESNDRNQTRNEE